MAMNDLTDASNGSLQDRTTGSGTISHSGSKPPPISMVEQFKAAKRLKDPVTFSTPALLVWPLTQRPFIVTQSAAVRSRNKHTPCSWSCFCSPSTFPPSILLSFCFFIALVYAYRSTAAESGCECQHGKFPFLNDPVAAVLFVGNSIVKADKCGCSTLLK